MPRTSLVEDTLGDFNELTTIFDNPDRVPGI